MEAIGHHVCSFQGGSEEVLQNAPFEAVHNPSIGIQQFLGTGYYYWDYNIEYAKIYGKRHYGKYFFIIESKLNLKSGTFLDLVGNRIHMEMLIRLRKWVLEKYPDPQYEYLGNFIELLKRLDKEIGEVKYFPYIAVRAIDLADRTEERKNIEFVNRDKIYSYMNLNPRIIICVYTKNKIVLQSSSIVYNGTER